jgi:stringent starvation protein B
MATIVEVAAGMAGLAVAIGVPVAVVLAIYDRNESVEKALDRWASQAKKDRTNRPARRHRIHPEAIDVGLVTAVEDVGSKR